MLEILLEVALISVGVFLGLAGQQWRENVQHRELAEESLRRFRSEIVTNRKSVAAVKNYHADKLKELKAYFAADPKARATVVVRFAGLQPVFFEHTAWDLALATQSLAYVDGNLAYSLSRVYNAQDALGGLTHGVTQAMYLRPPGENLEAFMRMVQVYYGDAVAIEPQLLTMYDDLLPRLDRAVGTSGMSKTEPPAPTHP